MKAHRYLLAATALAASLSVSSMARADFSYDLVPSSWAFALSGGASMGTGGSLVFGSFGSATLSFGSAALSQPLTISYSGFGANGGFLFGSISYAGNSVPVFSAGSLPSSISVDTVASGAGPSLSILGADYTLTSLRITSPMEIQGAPLPMMAGLPALAGLGLVVAYGRRNERRFRKQ